MMVRAFLLSWILALTPTPGSAEDFVVIAATGNDEVLQQGTVLPAGTVITLPEGRSVTLLSQGGTLVKLDGPLSRKLTIQNTAEEATGGEAWAVPLSRIADAISKKVERSNVVGSSRDTDTPLAQAEPDAWLLTVDSSGHRCLQPDGAILWRKKADETLKIDLRSQDEREKGLIWKAGTNEMTLPKKFIKDGTLIVMRIDAQPRRFNIHVLPESIAADRWGVVLHWMISKSCDRQAGVLVDDLHSGRLKLR